MTTPLRVTCPTTTDIPPTHQLRAWATDRTVVLRFPPGALTPGDKASVVARLAAALPERSVFDSSGDRAHEWVTVLRVIPTREVTANAAGYLAAMRLFRVTAADLAHRLADRLGVSPTDLLDRVTADDDSDCDLDGGWVSRPHGMECRFENRVMGQEVEVRLSFGVEFGVLDPYFFARFVKTTPGLEHLGVLLRHNFHDAARVIDLLAAGGHLTAVEGPCGGGWVFCEVELLPDPSSPCQAPPGWWGEP